MLKIIALEDEKHHMERLSCFLDKYRTEHPEFAYILEQYDSGILLLTEYKPDADIIFLDIQIPDMLGIDVAKHIRKIDENVMIIFVTVLTQYAIDGYSVGAFDYILKPIRYASFSAKLERLLRVLSHREPELMLDLKTKESSRRIPADNVVYIEVSAHDLLFHTDNEVIRQWGTLTEYEELLRGAHFARPSNSFLVNLKYVRGINKNDAVTSNGTVPISRAKRKDFLTTLAQYKGGSA